MSYTERTNCSGFFLLTEKLIVVEGLKGFDKVMSECPYPRKAVIGVLEALAKIRQDPKRQNDREAKKAAEILKHIKTIGLERWGVK